MRIFVTGGAGFIGSNTVDHLIACGLDARVYDNLSTGTLDNLRQLDEREQFVLGDILDLERMRDAMRGCDAVLHLAADVSVPASIERPMHAHAANASGTLNVLEAARLEGIRRVVLASSAAIYGAGSETPLREEAPPRLRSPYAAQKLLGEAYAEAYAGYHGLSPICLRYFNVFGPRQDPASPYSGVLSRFIAAAARRERITIHGDGNQTRDFVFVRDVALANRLALLAPEEGLAGAVFNVGTGRPTSVLAAYGQILLATGEVAPAEPIWAPERAGDVRHSRADTRRAKALLGFRARTAFDEGIAQTVAWVRGRAAAPTRVLIR